MTYNDKPFTVEQLKDRIRQRFAGEDWKRLGFCLTEVLHAVKNIPREWLRSIGLPESPGSRQNWVDRLALVISLLPVIFLAWLIIYAHL